MEYSNDRDVRVEAIRLSLELMRGQSLENSADKVVEGARRFEKFILGEKKEDGDTE